MQVADPQNGESDWLLEENSLNYIAAYILKINLKESQLLVASILNFFLYRSKSYLAQLCLLC